MSNYMLIIMFCLIITALVIAIVALVRANNEGFEGDSATACCTTSSCDSVKGWCIGTDPTSGSLTFNYGGKLVKSFSICEPTDGTVSTCPGLPEACQADCCIHKNMNCNACRSRNPGACMPSTVENYGSPGTNCADQGRCAGGTGTQLPSKCQDDCCSGRGSNQTCTDCMNSNASDCATPGPGPGPGPAKTCKPGRLGTPCSGHGTCDTTTGNCMCDANYGSTDGKDCDLRLWPAGSIKYVGGVALAQQYYLGGVGAHGGSAEGCTLPGDGLSDSQCQGTWSDGRFSPAWPTAVATDSIDCDDDTTNGGKFCQSKGIWGSHYNDQKCEKIGAFWAAAEFVPSAYDECAHGGSAGTWGLGIPEFTCEAIDWNNKKNAPCSPT